MKSKSQPPGACKTVRPYNALAPHYPGAAIAVSLPVAIYYPLFVDQYIPSRSSAVKE
jgi:hypothetical protein